MRTTGHSDKKVREERGINAPTGRGTALFLTLAITAVFLTASFSGIFSSAEDDDLTLGAPGDTVWAKNFGGSSYDHFSSVVAVADGFVAVGSSYSTDIDGITNKGGNDAIIVKFDLHGALTWVKNFGGSSNDYFKSVVAVADGFVAVGSSASTDIDGITNKGGSDAIIVKFGLDGTLTWVKNFGGSGSDYFYSVIAVDDGFVAVGESNSTDIGITNKGGSDAIIVKYGDDGTLTWAELFGGSGYDHFSSVVAVADGFVAVGNSASTDIDGITNIGALDAIIVKYGDDGTLTWVKNFGGSSNDYFYSVIAVDDGFVAVGSSASTDIDGVTNKGDYDAIIVKYGDDGTLTWAELFGGSDNDYFKSVVAVADGFVAVGNSNSTDIDGITNKGNDDAIIVKFDLDGALTWVKNFGGSGFEYFNSVIAVDDGFIAVGESDSTDIDGITNKGNDDVIIVKFEGAVGGDDGTGGNGGGNGDDGTGGNNDGNGDGNNLILILAVVAIVAVAGVLVYMFVLRPKA